MSEDPPQDEIGGYCPVCGTEYRPGFDVCADCGVALEPGPKPVREPGRTLAGTASDDEMPDEGFRRVLADLRADPDAFVPVATMPVADAWSTANVLWQHGIDTVFVPRDDPIAPPEPDLDPTAEDEPWEDEDDGDDGADGQIRDGDEGAPPPPDDVGAVGAPAWGWGSEGPRWVWETGAEPDPDTDQTDQDAEAVTDESDGHTEDETEGVAGPAPGLERTRPAIWTRPNRPMPAAVILFVRAQDEDEARRIAGRRIGVL